MGLVTAFWPFTMTGVISMGVQTEGGVVFGVDCKVKPTALAGHSRTTFAPERRMVSRGRLTELTERLNTVPKLDIPPALAVPYKVSPAKANPPAGAAPSAGPLKL